MSEKKEEKIEKTTVASNFLWSLMERWGAQGVTFIVSIILARLLEPTVYGVTAMAGVFTSILSVFIDSGLGSALVQKKDADVGDFSTVFYFNIFMCCAIYVAVFFTAPLVARFYNMPELTSVIRVSSLSLIIAGFKNILISVVQKNLQYRKFFFSTLGGTIGAAVIGIYMAFRGYGVWALVLQGLFNSLVDTIILWFTVGWRPKLYFSFKKLKALFPFGIRILATSLINTTYGRLRDLIIGKKYSAEDLAYYNKASGWPNLLFVNIGAAIDSVMFPVMSKAQEDKQRIKQIMSRTIRINTFAVFPLLAGLALCAEPAIEIILTQKWLPIAEYMRIFCLTCGMNAIGNTQINMVRSIGRSDWFLRLEIVKKGIDLVALLITMQISVKAMAYSLAVAYLLGVIINMVVVKKLLDYSILGQIKDFLPNICLCVAMAIPVFLIGQLGMSIYLKIVLQIICGAATYILLALLLKVESFSYLLNLCKRMVKKDR